MPELLAISLNVGVSSSPFNDKARTVAYAPSALTTVVDVGCDPEQFPWTDLDELVTETDFVVIELPIETWEKFPDGVRSFLKSFGTKVRSTRPTVVVAQLGITLPAELRYYPVILAAEIGSSVNRVITEVIRGDRELLNTYGFWAALELACSEPIDFGAVARAFRDYCFADSCFILTPHQSIVDDQGQVSVAADTPTALFSQDMWPAAVAHQAHDERLGDRKGLLIHGDGNGYGTTCSAGSASDGNRVTVTLVSEHESDLDQLDSDSTGDWRGVESATKYVSQMYAAGPPDEEACIVIDLEVPVEASDEEVASSLAQLATAADAVHRARGGSGLTVEHLEITSDIQAPEPVGAPND